MSGMPFVQALLLLISAVVLAAATRSRHLHPFVAIVIVASAFALAAGFSLAGLGKTFGSGFSQAVYSPGLVVVAAAFVAGLAEGTAAAAWFKGVIDHWRFLGPTRLAALFGFVAGIGASPANGYAILTPLLRAIGGGTAETRGAMMIASALALSASHGLFLFSPVMIAAASILDAAWDRVLLLGVPLSLLLAVCGAVWARRLPPAADPPRHSFATPPQVPELHGGWPASMLLAASFIPLLMLIVQSLGDIPSEPLGGGPAREMVLAFGRPLLLFLVGLAVMTFGLWRLSLKLFVDPSWTSRIIGDAAGVVLTVGAAGGLQRLCQETGMAELLGERLLRWHVGGIGALLVPFLIAAVIKTLQGSSLVAAITAAGMVQPLLQTFGLGSENARALAALAIGAGSMTVAHVNDQFFWLVSGNSGLSALRAMVAVTVGTLLQGVAAAAALLILFAFLSGV